MTETNIIHFEQEIITKQADFTGSFSNAIQMIKNHQQFPGIKETVKYLYISFLRSSVIDRYPYYRLDLYDAAKWNGDIDLYAYWDISFISRIIYDTFPKQKTKYGTIEKEVETEQLWIEQTENLHHAVSKHLALLAPVIEKELGNIIKLEYYFGEYLAISSCFFGSTNS